jgi:hypothetical protein
VTRRGPRSISADDSGSTAVFPLAASRPAPGTARAAPFAICGASPRALGRWAPCVQPRDFAAAEQANARVLRLHSGRARGRASAARRSAAQSPGGATLAAKADFGPARYGAAPVTPRRSKHRARGSSAAPRIRPGPPLPHAHGADSEGRWGVERCRVLSGGLLLRRGIRPGKAAYRWIGWSTLLTTSL